VLPVQPALLVIIVTVMSVLAPGPSATVAVPSEPTVWALMVYAIAGFVPHRRCRHGPRGRRTQAFEPRTDLRAGHGTIEDCVITFKPGERAPTTQRTKLNIKEIKIFIMVGNRCSRRRALKTGAGLFGGVTLITSSEHARARDRSEWDWENPEWSNQDDDIELTSVRQGSIKNDNRMCGEITDGIEHYSFKETSVTGTTVYEVPIIIQSSGVMNHDGDPERRIDRNEISVRTTGDYPVSMDFSPNEHYMGSFTYANSPDSGSSIDEEYTESAISASLAAASLYYPKASAASIAADVIFAYEYNSNEDSYSFDAKWNYYHGHDANEESEFSTWACFFLKLEPSHQTTFEVRSFWDNYSDFGADYDPYPVVTYEVQVTAPSSDEIYQGDVSIESVSNNSTQRWRGDC